MEIENSVNNQRGATPSVFEHGNCLMSACTTMIRKFTHKFSRAGCWIELYVS